MYNRKPKGPNTVPWGTPDRTGFVPLISLSTHTRWFLWVSQALIQFKTSPLIP